MVLECRGPWGKTRAEASCVASWREAPIDLVVGRGSSWHMWPSTYWAVSLKKYLILCMKRESMTTQLLDIRCALLSRSKGDFLGNGAKRALKIQLLWSHELSVEMTNVFIYLVECQHSWFLPDFAGRCGNILFTGLDTNLCSVPRWWQWKESQQSQPLQLHHRSDLHRWAAIWCHMPSLPVSTTISWMDSHLHCQDLSGLLPVDRSMCSGKHVR